MIKDRLKNAKNYYSISENLKKGFAWLESQDFNKIIDGRYVINGDDVYASVQTYTTKEDAKYEAHKKYIDIQYMINGLEKIGVTDITNCQSCTEYDGNKDLEFYDINSKEEYLELNQGQFMVFFPNDAHKPSIAVNEKTTVKKVVVKVLVD